MVKIVQDYVCQSCGAAASKWQGKCPSCGAWNSLAQEGSALSAPGGVGLRAKRKAKASAVETLDQEGRDVGRIVSGIAELDRAVGDGFAQGSAVLLSGEPGIGKSTLLLQAAASIAGQGHSALYFSGEEATDQNPAESLQAGSFQGSARTCRRDLRGAHSRNRRAGRHPRLHRHQFDPDAVDRGHRTPRPAR